MSDFLIRRAAIEDARPIAEVHYAGWKRAYGDFLDAKILAGRIPEKRMFVWEKTIRDKEYSIFVGLKDSRLMGFVTGGPILDHEITKGSLSNFDCELYNLHCHAEIEGKGLGRALIATLARSFLAEGKKSLILWAFCDNVFRKFYDRLGGKVVAEGLDEGHPEFAYGWENLSQLIARCEAKPEKPKDKIEISHE